MRGGETRGDGGRQSDTSFDSRAEDIHFVKSNVDGGLKDHHGRGSRRRRRHESPTTPRSLRATRARRGVMPARGGGAASRDAARRVAEDLLRLTLDPGPAPRDDSDDAGSGASVVGDARDASPERAVAALERLYASESYEDVRSAVVSALPRVRHPARFALACIERLAGGVDGAPRGPAPLVHLLAEALARSGPSLSRRAPRREFDATNEDATRLHDEIALGSAASLVLRAVRGAMRDATAGPPISDSRAVGRDDARERDGFRAEPRAVAKLAVASGVDLDDLRAAATREDRTGTRGDATPVRALVWYVGACLGGCFEDASEDPSSSSSRARRRSRRSAAVFAAASLARHFSLDVFATPTALDAFELSGHGALADGIVSRLPPSRRAAYVRRLSETFAESSLGTDPSPAERAERAMRRAGLAPAASSFAMTREARAREEARLRALCADGRWDLAAALAGSDPGLRDAARRFRADASSEGDRASSRPLSRVGRRSFLALDLPASSVLWCATLPALREAAERLAGDERIGLDSEWRPEGRDEDEDLSASASRRRRPRSLGATRSEHRVALLQLSGESVVALLDLPALTSASEGAPAVAAALRLILSAPRRAARAEEEGDGAKEKGGAKLLPPLVLGFGAREDLRRVARSYPGPVAAAIRDAPRVLDVREAARAARPEWRANPPGLAGLCEALLGRPLDKSQTTSDWEARPLTAAQIAYAALDARALVRLFPRLANDARDPGVPGVPAVPAETYFDGFDEESRRVQVTAPTRAPPLAPSYFLAALRERLATACGDRREPAILSADESADRPLASVVKSIGVMLRPLPGEDPSPSGTRSERSSLSLNERSSLGERSTNARGWVPAMLLLRGCDRADLGEAAKIFGVARRRVRLATAEECVRVFGYPPGSMPPMGTRGAAEGSFGKMPTLMDSAVRARAGRVFPGAGAPHLVFAVEPAVLERLADATVARIAEGVPRRGGYTLGDDEAPGPESFESFESTSRFRQTPGGPTRPEALADSGPRDDGPSDGPPEGEKAVAFACDGALGRLARWLRALGFDAEHVPAEPGVSGRVQHATLLRLAERERRVILTRDAGLMARERRAGAYLVAEDDPKKQFATVAARFGLRVRKGRLLTRCARCNGRVEARMSTEEVATRDDIPERVKRATSEFWRCDRCGKAYWVGPKSEKALEFIESDIVGVLAEEEEVDGCGEDEDGGLEAESGEDDGAKGTRDESRG